jgi:hypothetical protein
MYVASQINPSLHFTEFISISKELSFLSVESCQSVEFSNSFQFQSWTSYILNHIKTILRSQIPILCKHTVFLGEILSNNIIYICSASVIELYVPPNHFHRMHPTHGANTHTSQILDSGKNPLYYYWL